LSKARARISGRSTSIRNKAEAVISMANGVELTELTG
jgi:hypothetical protein